MVKIRLTRLGRHKNPFYRIVAIDSRSRRDGAYIKQIGTYEPFSGEVKINEEDTLTLLHQGAQPTDTVRSILKSKNIWKTFADQKLQKAKENSKNKTVKKETPKKVSKQTEKKPVKKVSKK